MHCVFDIPHENEIRYSALHKYLFWRILFYYGSWITSGARCLQTDEIFEFGAKNTFKLIPNMILFGLQHYTIQHWCNMLSVTRWKLDELVSEILSSIFFFLQHFYNMFATFLQHYCNIYKLATFSATCFIKLITFVQHLDNIFTVLRTTFLHNCNKFVTFLA